MPFLKALGHLVHLSKLRIIFSVVVTALAGYIIAEPNTLNWNYISILVFIITLSGAGSAIMNNLLDYSDDKKMLRTRSRTVAIDSLGKELLWVFSSVLVLVSLFTAYVFFETIVFYLLSITIFSYVVAYSLFLKKRSPFGVILGGLPGAIPLLIGYAVSGANFNSMIWLMFAFMMLWQPAHFWALSLKIKEDYRKAGIPILPLVYGKEVTKYYIYLYSFPLIMVSLATCYAIESSLFIYLIILLLNLYYFYITYHSLEKTCNYQRAFKSSLVYMGGYMTTFIFSRMLS